ncbi:MAG: DegT/DnrJ/EryC1/StrS family aminotransferase [Solirubrobacteraceae bacterium]
MSRDEFLVFGRPMIQEAEIADVVECLRSGWVGTGPRVTRFERLLEQYIGVAHVRCVSSCTAALTLGLLALGIGPGDEVLVPSMTFVATANAVFHTGADVVLVDCERGTGLIDLDAAEAAIGPRTRAVVPVHMAGAPVDMTRVNALRDRYGLVVVEDAAHALGAAWRDRRIGAHGNVTAYSFYVTKNITTIEGGALATEDEDVAEAVERLALHGLSVGAWRRFSDPSYVHYEVDRPGFKSNMTDVQAALGIHQLGRLDAWIERRAELWGRYDALLGDLSVEGPPTSPPEAVHARHLYRILTPTDGPLDRDGLIAALAAEGIGTGVHYRAVHLHPYYRDRYELAPERFPIATDMSERTLSLPLSPALTEADQRDVAAALTSAMERS